MFEMLEEEIDGVEVATLGAFIPWGIHKDQGGDGSNYPEHSGRILDVKSGQEAGLKYFADFMAPKIRTPGVVVIVPPSDPAKKGPGLVKLAKRLAALTPLSDSTSALIRHTKVAKLGSGDSRDIQVHLNSIAVRHQLIVGERVFLLDDILSTGNSMLACRRLLQEAGASDVICMALGRIAH